MSRFSRSTALKVAAVLSAGLHLYGIAFTLPMIAQGARQIDQGNSGPPYVVLLVSLIMGVVALVAAFGAWRGQRWGVILTILTNLINGLSAAPGILFAPNPGLMVTASLSVAISVAIIVLCLWPDRKLAAA